MRRCWLSDVDGLIHDIMAVDGTTGEKKKKKIKLKEAEVQDASVQTSVKLEETINDGEMMKKKKKKVKEEAERHNVSVQTSVKAELNIDDPPEKTKKKKTKKYHVEDGDHLVSKKPNKSLGDEVENVTKKQTRKIKEEQDGLGESAEIVKKKKKKKKRGAEEVELVEEETKTKRIKKEPDQEEHTVRKKKKKKWTAEEETEKDEDQSHLHLNGGCVMMKKKKKKKKVPAQADDITEKVEEPVGKKKRKDDRKKTKEKVPQKTLKEEPQARARSTSDVVFLSARPGNQDEVSIDQARRVALQKDVDKESQPNLGQWSTASFNTADRQAKFLRLMGGFKKSSQPITAHSGSASMALGTEGQRTLQQGLLGEFERAQNRHMDFRNKGAGLGFAAASRTTFTIDTNARNSVRLDD